LTLSAGAGRLFLEKALTTRGGIVKGLEIELAREIDLADFGEITLFAGDIDGDGRVELVFPQGEDGPEPRASTGFYPHEKTIRCITAIDLEGNVLWQRGEPMGPDFRKYHGRGPCLVHDLDADGKSEIVYVTAADDGRVRLRLLKGEDGSLVRERETWAAYDVIPANLRGLESRRDFIVGDGLRLVFAYDEELNPLWRWHRYYGGGHHHAVADVEGMGADDVFIGVSRLDARGERVWWRPDLDDVMERMRCCPHMDKIEVRRLHAGRDDWQVLWIGGHDAACLDARDGRLLWRLKGEHIHNYAVGRFDPGSGDEMVYLSEKDRDGPSWMVSADGEILWERMLGPGGAAAVRRAGPSGEDLLVLGSPPPGERPYVMTHRGEKWAELAPLPPRDALPQVNGRGADSGRAFVIHCFDVDGDGREEILAFNRERLFILKATA
jgi:hypothetical protein